MANPAPHAEKFKLIVDHKPFEWPDPTITGAQIKQLVGITDPAFGVWQLVPGPGEDLEVPDTQPVDLRKPGTEKFATGKKTTTEG